MRTIKYSAITLFITIIIHTTCIVLSEWSRWN